MHNITPKKQEQLRYASGSKLYANDVRHPLKNSNAKHAPITSAKKKRDRSQDDDSLTQPFIEVQTPVLPLSKKPKSTRSKETISSPGRTDRDLKGDTSVVKQELIRKTMQIQKQAFQIRSLHIINTKLNQQLNALREEYRRKNQYINRIEGQLIKKASQIDQKLLKDLQGAENKLKEKDKELRGAVDQAKKAQELRKEYDILRSFVNKAGHNTSKHIIALQNQKIDLEMRVLQLEQLLDQWPRQKQRNKLVKLEELVQQCKKEKEELQFYLEQKEQHLNNLTKENARLKKLVADKGSIGEIKENILRIIQKHHPQIFL